MLHAQSNGSYVLPLRGVVQCGHATTSKGVRCPCGTNAASDELCSTQGPAPRRACREMGEGRAQGIARCVWAAARCATTHHARQQVAAMTQQCCAQRSPQGLRVCVAWTWVRTAVRGMCDDQQARGMGLVARWGLGASPSASSCKLLMRLSFNSKFSVRK